MRGLIDEKLLGHDPGDDLCGASYVLPTDDNLSEGYCLNFCPFCGTVLPGALVTDWEKHENCDACHWTGPQNSAMMPKCICSKGYEELKRTQDETNQSN
jgi:hypothetical protein